MRVCACLCVRACVIVISLRFLTFLFSLSLFFFFDFWVCLYKICFFVCIILLTVWLDISKNPETFKQLAVNRTAFRNALNSFQESNRRLLEKAGGREDLLAAAALVKVCNDNIETHALDGDFAHSRN